MKIIEIIENVDKMSDDLVIFIDATETFNKNSEAGIRTITDLVINNQIPEGMKYYLEVMIAKKVLQVWREWRNGRTPTLNEKFQAITYFVQHDSYQPINEKLE